MKMMIFYQKTKINLDTVTPILKQSESNKGKLNYLDLSVTTQFDEP